MKATSIAVVVSLLLLSNNDPTGAPRFQHPLIANHGGIVPLPNAAHQPAKNSKVLLDITSEEKTGNVLKAFDRAALILNQYTAAEAGTEHGFKMALILHGAATKAALNHEAYAAHSQPYPADARGKNPNLELLSTLQNAGVEIYVCGQALAHHGYATTAVAAPVQVVVSAATAAINLQTAGYAYIPFK